jgi:hypothetical protein
MKNNRVKLNVGGKIFETEIRTLIISPVFNRMFSDIQYNKNDEIFIDRSPYIFKHILSYLRDGTYRYPEKYDEELRYFEVKPPKRETVYSLESKILSIIAAAEITKMGEVNHKLFTDIANQVLKDSNK